MDEFEIDRLFLKEEDWRALKVFTICSGGKMRKTTIYKNLKNSDIAAKTEIYNSSNEELVKKVLETEIEEALVNENYEAAAEIQEELNKFNNR